MSSEVTSFQKYTPHNGTNAKKTSLAKSDSNCQLIIFLNQSIYNSSSIYRSFWSFVQEITGSPVITETSKSWCVLLNRWKNKSLKKRLHLWLHIEYHHICNNNNQNHIKKQEKDELYNVFFKSIYKE